MSGLVQRSSELEVKEAAASKPAHPKKTTWKGRSVYLIVAKLLGGLAHLASKVHTFFVGNMTIADYEANVHKQFGSDAENILKKLNTLPPKEYKRIVKRLIHAHIDERPLIAVLATQANAKQWQEILKGAHVRVPDDGDLYEQLRKNPKAIPRRSSHPSVGQQYAIRGNFLSEHLFGQVDVEQQRYSWFQLENHPMSFGHAIRHMLDYLKYKATGKQQGPHGSSIHTDKNPIILNQSVGA